ncbi:MAG: translocation/assembly module TamB domain-containing protein, partial [Janthinobacterium lividum]
INLKIKVKKLSLVIEGLNMPREFLQAYAESEINVIKNIANPEISIKLAVDNIRLASGDTQSITLNSTYINERIDCSLFIKSNSSMGGNLKLSLPAEISLLPYKFQIKQDKKITGNLNLNSQIDVLASLFLSPIHHLKGVLDISARIAGSLNVPYIQGLATITEGKYDNVQTGIKIKNINFIVEAQGQKILLKEFRAHDDEKKTFVGTGYFDLDKKNLPFDFNFKADNFYFLNHPNIQSAVKADIKISGDSKHVDITGNIEPKFLEIHLPEQFEKEVYELNVTKIITNKGEKSAINQQHLFYNYQVNLDVTIFANNKVFIRGWGLDAELGGKLKCGGNAKTPLIKGNLETIHGKYQEFGKQFTIKEGSLVFSGSVPPSPFLNIIASSAQDDTEVMIVISGPLLTPKLSIESNPPLPQDEALSILLFGKQSNQISPFQAIQLADSIRRLSGHGSSTNILDKARGIFKLDDIRLKNSSNNVNDAALGIGKYITDKIYLEVEKGIQEGSGKTRVEVEIKNHLTVESSIGESGGSVGVNWKMDY